MTHADHQAEDFARDIPFDAVSVITGPSVEPLSLAEVKDHLRIDEGNHDHDERITAAIAEVRDYVEAVLGRALITQTARLTMTRWKPKIKVPLAPLQSVTSITYLDTTGAEQTLASSNYRVITAYEPGIIEPAYGTVWPNVQDVIGAISITFVCGYGGAADTVPAGIRHAMKLMLGDALELRENTLVGAAAMEIPTSAKSLLAPYRMFFGTANG